MITLKVQGIDREEALMMLESSIGVQVIDCCEILTESQPDAAALDSNTEVFPVQNVDVKIPWLLETK
jgi:hypothetical protein